MTLFLDIDGVLRRKQAPLYRMETILLTRLAELMKSHPQVTIVISSSWTDAFSMDTIKGHFPAELRGRISGRTPRIQTLGPYERHAEVLAYLESTRTKSAWVALDDDPLNFPKSAPVVLVDPKTGLDEKAVEALRQHFFAAAQAARPPSS